MDALQAAQRVYDSTIRNLAGKEVELDVATALEVATFCAVLAQAEQMKRIADALEGITGKTYDDKSFVRIGMLD